MNPAALRSSWARVAEHGDRAAKHFYATLFILAPDTRQMFPNSMSGQNDKLLSALGHIVSHVDCPDVLGSFAAQLGADHRRFEAKPRHYAVVGQALLATLERFLGPAWTPQLCDDWRSAYEAISAMMLGGAELAASRTPPWWTCQVVDIHRPTPEVAVFTVLPDYLVEYRAGQSFPVQGPSRDGWRYLSPANAPRADGTIEFHLRAVGQVSSGLVRRLQAGDQLQLGAAIGVGLAEYGDSTKDLVMIAGGTGVAPMRAVIEAMTHGRPRRTALVYGAPTANGLYAHPDLAALAAQTAWLKYIPTVQWGPHWRGQTGTAIDVALSRTDWRQADVMVCGSPKMVAASTVALRDRGLAAGQIYTEQHTSIVYPRLVGADTTRRELR